MFTFLLTLSAPTERFGYLKKKKKKDWRNEPWRWLEEGCRKPVLGVGLEH